MKAYLVEPVIRSCTRCITSAGMRREIRVRLRVLVLPIRSTPGSSLKIRRTVLWLICQILATSAIVKCRDKLRGWSGEVLFSVCRSDAKPTF